MREVNLKVFSVDELNEQALEKAYEAWYHEADYGWGDENEATLKAFEAIFPVGIRTWEYDQHRGFVRFEFTEDSAIYELTGIRLATYLYNNYYTQITKGKYYSLWSKKEKSPLNPSIGKLKSRHSKVLIEEHDCALTGYYMDNVILAPIFDYMRKPDNTNFYDLMEDCFDQWAKASANDYAACLSREYFIDEAQSNNYEFYADGTPF